jgi:2,5-diketo-D-gluconate reductase A
MAVGKAIADSGVDRSDIFLTTKLFPQDYGKDRCMDAIDASLRRLGTDYVDLLLLHQPYGAYTEAWKVLDVAEVVPQVLQVEINPRNNQHVMKRWLDGKGVVLEGWYPLGHGDRDLLELPVLKRLAEKYGKSTTQVILRWHVQGGNVVFRRR